MCIRAYRYCGSQKSQLPGARVTQMVVSSLMWVLRNKVQSYGQQVLLPTEPFPSYVFLNGNVSENRNKLNEIIERCLLFL